MQFTRSASSLVRRALVLALATAGLATGGFAQAQTAAQKQLASDKFTVVSPFPPGGPVDMLARILSDGLAKRYNVVSLVENPLGAAGNIGIDRVKKAKPDGHTLLVIPAGNLTINPTLMKNFPFDIQKDFVAVTMLAKAPNILVTNPMTGYKTAKDVIAAAKAKPDTLSFASPGVGSGLHLAGELFKLQTDTEMLHVPYKGTPPAMNDVIGGAVPLMFSNLPAVLPQLKSGKLVAIGLTESARSPVAPEIPTLAEQGVSGVVVTSWYGILAPAGTPADVVEQLAKDAADFLAQPAVREQLKAQGLVETIMTPKAFDAHIRAETATWAKIIKTRNITAE
jgi:tripartite-type tricarboxylate transporter receptor subunit TctC